MWKSEKHIPRKPCLRKWIDRYKSWRLYKYYTSGATKARNVDQMVIYMADGRMKHGGLSDRICGMVSTYNYCKKHGLGFKIHFVCPYSLSDFLECSSIDWRISDDEISYNSHDSEPIYLSVYSGNYNIVEMYFNNRIGRSRKKQVHVYTNARYFHKHEFSGLFNDLFKPSLILQNALDHTKELIPKPYISLTFRFQQLLGDFKEDGFKTLKTEEEKHALMDKCLNCIRNLYNQAKSKVLVTSDSVTFLDNAGQLDYVYTIPGEMRHEDYGKDLAVDKSIDLKSFVDFFMIAEAEKIYLYANAPLWPSGFPITASFIHNKELIMIR